MPCAKGIRGAFVDKGRRAGDCSRDPARMTAAWAKLVPVEMEKSNKLQFNPCFVLPSFPQPVFSALLWPPRQILSLFQIPLKYLSQERHGQLPTKLWPHSVDVTEGFYVKLEPLPLLQKYFSKWSEQIMLMTSHCKVVIDFLRIHTNLRKAFKLVYQKMNGTVEQDTCKGRWEKKPTTMWVILLHCSCEKGERGKAFMEAFLIYLALALKW